MNITTIQENMNYLAELLVKFPNYKEVIDNAADLITWCGVQPELEAFIMDGKPCIMLFWNYKEDAYMAFYADASDVVRIEIADEDGEAETFELTKEKAITYYQEEMHLPLFIFEQGLKQE